jgi:hypothetical protein
LGDPIHAVKNAANLDGNPNVWMDVTNGNVYLQVVEDEEIEYELLDNLLDYFP